MPSRQGKGAFHPTHERAGAIRKTHREIARNRAKASFPQQRSFNGFSNDQTFKQRSSKLSRQNSLRRGLAREVADDAGIDEKDLGVFTVGRETPHSFAILPAPA